MVASRLACRWMLVVAAGCGHFGFDPSGPGSGATSVDAEISAAFALTIEQLDARIAFAGLDPNALYGLSAQAAMLPQDVVFPLPDASGPLAITLDAIDQHGRQLTVSGSTTVVAGDRATVALVIGGDLPASCANGVMDAGETDIDCGGPCPACAIGQACSTDADCLTGSCPAGSCEQASGPPGWLPIASMPVARIGHAAVLGSDDRIYVFGGSLDDHSNDYQEVDVYDPATATWGSAPALPTARERIAGTADAAGTIYALGGVDMGGSLYYDVVETFTPGQPAWATAPAMPVARASLGATTDANGTVYAFGGVDPGQISENDAFDGTAWAVRTPLPAVRSNLGVARGSDGRMLAIGGHPGTLSSVVAYDPTGGTWMTLPSLQHARSDLAAAGAPDGRVYAIGGFDGASGVVFVEAIRPNGAWVPVASLSTGRDAGASAVGPDGRIYAFGGRDAPGNGQTSAEVYGPILQLAATTGSAGDSITVTGSNFAANAAVRIYFDATPVELATTDASGALATFQVIVPQLASGPHLVRAIDDRSAYPVSRPFTIQ